MKKILALYLLLFVTVIGTFAVLIISNHNFSDPYNTKELNLSAYSKNMLHFDTEGFSKDLVAVPADGDINADLFSNETYAALLVDNTDKKTIVSHNTYRRIYPASTTKTMTALMVCEAIQAGKLSLDDEITLQNPIYLSEPDAVASDISVGDTITVRNLLYGLMIKSYNDYAIILARVVGGDEDTFVSMMNQRAKELGATGCHFVNPHGLHDSDHYVTAYDMYIILTEAEKYDILKEIDQCTSYHYSYTLADGSEYSEDITPTNQFLSGQATLPSNITINGWKTGTTEMAGHVLNLNVTIGDKNYSIFVADSTTEDALYTKITYMFNLAEGK